MQMTWRTMTAAMLSLSVFAGCGATGGTLEPWRFSELPPGHTEANVYYPKGDVTESVLMMRTSGPKQVRAGETFEYKIELYNPTDRAIVKDIVVTDRLSPDFELISSTPDWTDLNRFEEKQPLATELRTPNDDLDDAGKAAPTIARSAATHTLENGNHVHWYIEELYPEKLVTIKVRGRAHADGGNWASCATARYDLSACMTAKIVSPELKLVTQLERDFVLCATDETDLNLCITNSGTGETRNVTVKALLPEGLSVDGSQEFVTSVGTIQAGQTKTMSKPVRVHAPGRYVVHASAQSAAGIAVDAAAVTLTARRPQLQVATDGPREEYVGLPVEHDIRVSNTGDATAHNVVIEAQIPKGTTFVDATHNAKADGNLVRWTLPELPAGQHVPLSVRFEGKNPGYVRTIVTASSECEEGVCAIARTELEGVASMVVEVVDTNDPIKVGQNEVYEIRVTNQGSAAETDVLVACKLDAGQSVVKTEGATKTRSSGPDTVVFEPVDTLGPTETATWKVMVRGDQRGDKRFRVTVESDQHGRPVRESEATRVFN